MEILDDVSMAWIIDFALTSSAQLMLLVAGLKLRRYVATRRRGRPIAESLGTRLFARSRPARLRRYEGMATGVLNDVGALLIQDPLPRSEARALLPIVAEVRTNGERLVNGRTPLTSYLSPLREGRVAWLVRDLARVETLLRELPRSHLTLEDVLAGRFDLKEGAGSG